MFIVKLRSFSKLYVGQHANKRQTHDSSSTSFRQVAGSNGRPALSLCSRPQGPGPYPSTSAPGGRRRWLSPCLSCSRKSKHTQAHRHTQTNTHARTIKEQKHNTTLHNTHTRTYTHHPQKHAHTHNTRTHTHTQQKNRWCYAAMVMGRNKTSS